MAVNTGTTSTIQVALLIIGCVSLLPQSEGERVRCWRCRHTTASNDNNAAVRVALKAFTNSVGNNECELKDSVNDKYAVDVVECPEASDSGMMYKCSTVRGKVTTTAWTFAVIWDTTVRDCIQVPTGDSEYNGCKETDVISGPLRYLLTEGARGLEKLNIDADVKFSGKTCYDVGLSSIPDRSTSLQCVTCSRNELKSGTPIVGSLLSLFTSKVLDDACLMENPDDTYRVGSRICPEPKQDQQAVCGVISGVISSSMTGVGDIKFLTTERGCVTQPTGEQRSGCTKELPPDGTIKQLLKQGIQSLNLDVTFDGQVCYSDNGFGMVTPLGLVAVGRGGHTHSPFSVLVLCLCGLLTIIVKTYF